MKIQISAPPLDGRANHRLIEFLARQMGLKRSQLEILTGLHARAKTIAVSKVSESELMAALQQMQSRSNRPK